MKFFLRLFFFFSFILLTNVCLADVAYGPPANFKICFNKASNGTAWLNNYVPQTQPFCIERSGSLTFPDIANPNKLTPFELDAEYATWTWLLYIRPIAGLPTPTLKIALYPFIKETTSKIAACRANPVIMAGETAQRQIAVIPNAVIIFSRIVPTDAPVYKADNISIYCSPPDVETNDWLDPSPWLRYSPLDIPSEQEENKVDFVQVMLHELGHGFGFSSERNPQGEVPPPIPDSLKNASKFDTFTMQIKNYYPSFNNKGKNTFFRETFSLTPNDQTFFIGPNTVAFLKAPWQNTAIRNLPGIPLSSPVSKNPKISEKTFSHVGLIWTESTACNNLLYRKSFYSIFSNDLMQGECALIGFKNAKLFDFKNARQYISMLDLKVMQDLGYTTVPLYTTSLPYINNPELKGFKLLSVTIKSTPDYKNELAMIFEGKTNQNNIIYVVIKTVADHIQPINTILFANDKNSNPWKLSGATFSLNLELLEKAEQPLSNVKVNLLGSFAQDQEGIQVYYTVQGKEKIAVPKWTRFMYAGNKIICTPSKATKGQGPVFVIESFNDIEAAEAA